MRVQGATIQKFVLGLALLAAVLWNLASAAEIKDLRVQSGATGTRAELTLAQEAEFKVISLADPHRLVVDLPGSSVGKGLRMPAPSGLVKAVRTGHPVPGTVRIVFDLAAPVAVLRPRFEPGADGARLVLEWPGDSAASTDQIARIAAQVGAAPAPAVVVAAPVPATAVPSVDPAKASNDATSRLVAGMASVAPPPAPQSSAAPPRPQPAGDQAMPRPAPAEIRTAVPVAAMPPAAEPPAPVAVEPAAPPRSPLAMRAGMRPLVIAIDPGHGGQDPGAVGPSGKREKDITLAIARELARQVNATPGLKAYLTRDSDVFIPLPKRAQLARAAKADMFISIHADAAENRNAKGSSVYVLSLKGASSQRARWLADKENAADLIGGGRMVKSADNTLNSVLLDLTQSGHMKASEDAGNHILSGLKRIGNNHKPHIERANFAVLRTSDMPSMLVETAFLSNPDEERRLIDPAFQISLARAVLDGVNTYFTSQPPPGTLYAARAQAGNDATTAGGGSP